MKNIAALFLGLCFAPLILYSQDMSNGSSYRTKSSEGLKQKLDSIMAQELDEESNRWNYTDKLIYRYDNKNNPSLYTYYSNEGNSYGRVW